MANIILEGQLTPFEVDVYLDEKISELKTQIGEGDLTGVLATLTALQNDINTRVPNTRKVAGKALSSDITLAKADVGLGNVENYGMATKLEAEAGVIENKYMNPLRTTELVLKNFVPKFTTIAGIDLSTNITAQNLKTELGLVKADVGLGNVENYPKATKAEAEAGTSDVKYMTPLRSREGTTKYAVPLTRKVNGKALSSDITLAKADVGLGNVENYPIASQTEAEAGASNTKYMTPLGVSQQVVKYYVPNFRTVAGLPLSASITTQALKTALGTTDPTLIYNEVKATGLSVAFGSLPTLENKPYVINIDFTDTSGGGTNQTVNISLVIAGGINYMFDFGYYSTGLSMPIFFKGIKGSNNMLRFQLLSSGATTTSNATIKIYEI